ncbi:MAG TPA: M1 family aminopeptidase [Planctomycetota bacterium]|nr:M1 family aminopeptidase [Planctomycetota bacterium]
MNRTAVPFAVLLCLSRAAAQLDVTSYDLAVELRGNDLAVAASIEATGKVPAQWRLELAPQMKVLSAEAGGKAVPFTVRGSELVLDFAKAGAATGTKVAVAVRCEGAPSERFSKERGGYVRSAVAPDLVYVRSQVPWYPRAADDPAEHKITVDAPADWQVRCAGDFTAPQPKDARAVWTFATKGPIDRAGIAAGPWQVVRDGASDALVTAPHAQAASAMVAKARETIEFHARDLGPLALERFTLIEMPESFGSGSGYSECGYILLGPGAFEAGPGAGWVARFLAHETAHQWWGQDGLFSDFANEMLAEYAAFRCVRATAGAEAGNRMRSAARERLGKAVAGGKVVALGSIEGWGGGMDAETYEVHAYHKGMLLLAAVEDAVGDERMQAGLRQFLDAARKTRAGWKDLRRALCALGPNAKEVVETWERPGLPGGVEPPPAGASEAKAAFEAGMKIANSPKEADPKVLAEALAKLRLARNAKELGDGEQAAAQTGIGRCLFRLGKHDEAAKELGAALALGAGGPFHRGWVHLRLGNIDDLRGKRKDALVHYQAVLDNKGASKTTIEMAKRFLEKPYRGFAQDG